MKELEQREEYAIEVKNLTKKYDGFTLDHVSFGKKLLPYSVSILLFGYVFGVISLGLVYNRRENRCLLISKE